MNGIGGHEVNIETPDQAKTLASMSEGEIERVLWAFRARTHSQLIGLPIVPDLVGEELEGARRDFVAKERCVYFDILHQEIAGGHCIIVENADMVALAPYAPRFPFETWATAAATRARFEEAHRRDYESLARLLKVLPLRVNCALESPSYNVIVRNSPFTEETADLHHWHLELIPRLTRVEG